MNLCSVLYHIVDNSCFFETQINTLFISKTTSLLNPSIANCCPFDPILTDFNLGLHMAIPASVLLK